MMVISLPALTAYAEEISEQTEAEAEAETEALTEDTGETAEEAAPTVSQIDLEMEETPISVSDDTDPTDLFAEYVDQVLAESSASGGKKKAGKPRDIGLTDQNALIYTILSQYIMEVAAGDRANTEFYIPVESFFPDQTFWTAAELGVEDLWEGGGISSAAYNKLEGKLTYDLQLVLDKLLANHPYSLYWFDKTAVMYPEGFSVSLQYDHNKGDYVLGFTGGITMPFAVAEEYALDTYTMDTSIGKAVQTTVTAAQSIVARYAVKTDYEKLEGYLREICALTSYNHEAAETDMAYGNPWQIIWVFDGDAETNVVCEGYSKAFKYLCDLSSFNSNIGCILVNGVMSGATGGGRHMWNIVTMGNEKNYLVDATNCDEGSIGAPDQLFLAGTETKYTDGSRETGYRMSVNGSSSGVLYTYGDDCLNLYSDAELSLSTTDYDPAAEPDLSSAPVILRSASVAFDDIIGLNYKTELPEELAEDPDAYAEYTFCGNVTQVKISDMTVNSSGHHVFTVPVWPKLAHETITVRFYGGDGHLYPAQTSKGVDVTQGHEYSVAAYCNAIQSASSNAKMKDLALKLEQYCSYAQKYLKYDAENADCTLDLSSVTTEQTAAYAGSTSGSTEGISLGAISFSFEEASELNVKFKLAAGAVIGDYTFTVDGAAAEAVKSGNYYVVTVKEIKAPQLGTYHAVAATGSDGNTLTVNVTGLSYAHSILKSSGSSQEAKDVVRALYLYYMAAKEYFG